MGFVQLRLNREGLLEVCGCVVEPLLTRSQNSAIYQNCRTQLQARIATPGAFEIFIRILEVTEIHVSNAPEEIKRPEIGPLAQAGREAIQGGELGGSLRQLQIAE